MIRPFTCVCLLLAAGSGMYTYQAKHQAELLDRQIAGVLKQADAARQRSGMLRAEYALLNDPERLRQLAAAHLPALRTTTPVQFTYLAGLDRRLPPVGPPPSAAPPLTEPSAIGHPEMVSPDALPTDATTPPPLPIAALSAAHATLVATAAARTPTPQTPANPSIAQPGVGTPVGAPVASAVWPVTNRPTAVASKPDSSGRPAVVAQSLPPASRARPPQPKTALAARQPSRSDAFMTPVSAPTEALSQLAAASPSVGRSGLGGRTVSALGMARMAGGTPLFPATLPSR